MTELRPYQQAAIDDLWRYWQNGGRAPLIVAPTGAGKSHLIAEVLHRLARCSDYHCLMLTHRRELIVQNARKLRAIAPSLDIGIYAAGLGRKDLRRITFAQIQSLARARAMPPARLAVIDEAHLVPHKGLGQYRSVLAALRESEPELRLLGLTATDFRMHGGRLTEGKGALFDGVAHSIPVDTLIAGGYLVEPISYGAGVKLELDRVPRTGGEYQIAAQDARIEAQVAAVVERLMTAARGRRKILVFCPGVLAVNLLTAELAARGESARSVTGATPTDERDAVIGRFRAAGGLRWLVNCDVLTTGFDAPETDCLALLRATASPVLYVQMVGRGMRPAPDKTDCLVLDFGGNGSRHGPIDDVDVGRSAARDTVPPLKECPACFRLCPAATRTCPGCGAEFPYTPQPRTLRPGAADDAPMLKRNRPTERTVDVRLTQYHRAPGRDGKPDHIQAIYTTDDGEEVREFFCPDHGGYAAQVWQRRRTALGSAADSVDECEAEKGRWPAPVRIRVARDGRYWRVTEAVYAD